MNPPPIWTSNIAYNMRLFQHGLRFDSRYNCKGKGIGGGEDAVMFQQLLRQGCRLVYEPEMVVLHLIHEKKIKRRYFLKLHYLAGKKTSLYKINPEGKKYSAFPALCIYNYLKKFIRLFISILNIRLLLCARL